MFYEPIHIWIAVHSNSFLFTRWEYPVSSCHQKMRKFFYESCQQQLSWAYCSSASLPPQDDRFQFFQSESLDFEIMSVHIKQESTQKQKARPCLPCCHIVLPYQHRLAATRLRNSCTVWLQSSGYVTQKSFGTRDKKVTLTHTHTLSRWVENRRGVVRWLCVHTQGSREGKVKAGITALTLHAAVDHPIMFVHSTHL